jgi:hypothetical protein
MAIQVVTSVSNTAWTSEKVEIATTNADVTLQVSVVQQYYIQANGVPANAVMTTPIGNLYSNALVVPGNSVQQYYVGAGNYLNIITGTGFTASQCGAIPNPSSAVKGV